MPALSSGARRLADIGFSTSQSADRVPEFIELRSGINEQRHHELEPVSHTTAILIELDLALVSN